MDANHERMGRGCFGKVRYPSVGDAQRMILTALEKRGHRVRSYHCELCDGWHLSRLRGGCR